MSASAPSSHGEPESPQLTIGMATYRDFDGVYFTLQALRLYQDLTSTELIVVDNYGCPFTRAFVENIGARYILATGSTGTAYPRDVLFREACGFAVLCCDCHVLFAPAVIARLKRFYAEQPDCADLLQGPLVSDDGQSVKTHMDPAWRPTGTSGDYHGVDNGKWATDPRGADGDGEPFEIPMQGLGAFACRRNAWLGFNPDFTGFGGEEGYIHEKFRRADRRTLCLPWFRWMHRFGRPGTPYPGLTNEAKAWNHLIGHAELGLDPTPVLEYFSFHIPAPRLEAIRRSVDRRLAAVVAPRSAPPSQLRILRRSSSF